MFSSQDYGSPVFWTSHERPEPRSPRRRIAFTYEAMRRRGEKGWPPRLLNPSGAFNDPFYPQIRVKNQFLSDRRDAGKRT
jgi:hypothetical protein